MNLYRTRPAQNVRWPEVHKNHMDLSGPRTLIPTSGAGGYSGKLRPSFDVMGRLFSYMALQIKPGERLVTTGSSEAHSLKVASYKLYAGTLLCLVVSTFLMGTAFAQAASPRITAQIDNSQRATIAGTHPALARSTNDAGRVPSTTRLQGVTLVFSLTPGQQADLLTLIAAQQNPSSPLYNQWLTPDQYAARFGMSDADIATTESWLQQQGFSIDSVARSKNRIAFSGTAGQAEATFGTELHYYKSGSATSYAPSTDITLPAALSSVVQTVSNLSSFRPKPRVRIKTGQRAPTGNFTSSQSGNHYLTPKDVATIYDINAAYNSSYTGNGQSIAIVGQSAVVLSDIENFQSAAGLTVKDPTVVLVPSSGTSATSTGDEAESDLDLEYSGGIAKGAKIYFVYVGNNQSYSVWDSIEYAVDTKIATIISASYGACETELSSSDYSTLNGILAQAATQGQTVVAAAGDDGSTDCYGDTDLTASQREAVAVDFPASSQYVTGMGGTEFPSADVSSSNTTYWQSASGSDVMSSALSYIPEQVWNDDPSDATSSELASGGGGTSNLTARPSWQTGVTGIPSGIYRLVPDLSLDSSPNNAGYLYCSSDSSSTGISGSCSNGFRDSNNTYLTVAGGTSFAAPIFAGMLAIINQKLNSTGQGVINSTLYTLAANSTTYASVFHDITSGGNQCTAGSSYCSSAGESEYAATTGYDEASGLGSVDLYNLLSAWPTTSSTSSLDSTTTTLSAATTSPTSGASDVITIQVASTSSSVSTTPTGTLTVAVDGTTVVSSLALSNGSATYTFSSSTSGSHVITATYSGDSTFASSTGTVTVTIGSTTSTSSGGSGSTTVTVTPSGGYTGTVDLTLSTSSTYLQEDACYSISNATITNTTPVSETLNLYTGSANCSSAQIQAGKVHSFRSTTKLSSDSARSINAATFGVFGLLLALYVGRRSRQIRGLCCLLALATLAFGLSGCSSPGSTASSSSKSFSVSVSPSTVTVSAGTSGIPSGSYSVTITGTDSSSSSKTASTTMTLTIS
jgi:subtilase family serine protease